MMVSVVIPTWNRCDILHETVRRSLAQELAEGELEVIVVDDRSDDGTAEWLEAEAARRPPLRWVPNPGKGRAAARNTGLAHARGELICFLDDDLWMEPGCLEAHRRAHAEAAPHAVAVMGRMLPWPGNEPTVANLAFDRHLTRVVGEMEAHGTVLPREYLCTGNVSLPRSAAGHGALFDEGFTGYSFEDTELGYRLEDRGLGLRLEPRALAYHRTRTSIAENLRKCSEAGGSAVLFLTKHPRAVDRLSPPYEVPGVPGSRRPAPLRRHVAKALFLSAACGGLLAAGARAVAALHWRAAALELLGWACMNRYGRSFRRAARQLARHPSRAGAPTRDGEAA